MKRIIIVCSLSILTVCFGIFFFINSESKAEACCNGGKCVGSANCRSCTNCSRCGHCKSGGSCGVCATYSAPTPKDTKPKSITKTNTSSTPTIQTEYSVNVKTLNVRSEPNTSSSIVYTLKYGEVVLVLKVMDSKWVKIKVKGITGYVNMQYLALKN